jgi:hypothetical protein
MRAASYLDDMHERRDEGVILRETSWGNPFNRRRQFGKASIKLGEERAIASSDRTRFGAR